MEYRVFPGFSVFFCVSSVFCVPVCSSVAPGVTCAAEAFVPMDYAAVDEDAVFGC
jgi:hypothetical protein